MRRARVLIADPLPLFRAGVRNLLKRESDLEVLEASSSDEAAALLAGGYCGDRAHRPRAASHGRHRPRPPCAFAARARR